MTMQSKVKTSFAVVLLSGVLGCAIWQKLQFIAVAALVGLTGVIYKEQAQRLIDLAYEMLGDARVAKYGDLEIQLGKNLKDFSSLTVKKAVGLQILLSQLEPAHVSLLLAIKKQGRFCPTDSVKGKLRDLRNRGLLVHNASTMALSKEVWLTDFGSEVAEVLLEMPDSSSHTQD